MAIGFKAQAEGLFIPDAKLFYCASNAALASIATTPIANRKKTFNEVIARAKIIPEKEVRDISLEMLAEIPVDQMELHFHNLVSHLSKVFDHNENPKFSYLRVLSGKDDPWAVLQELTAAKYGSSKILTRDFVSDISCSIAGILSADVESRDRGQIERKYKITVDRPFIGSLDDLKNMRFQNGSAFEVKLENRTNPLFADKPEDDYYLSRSKYADVFTTSQIVGFTRYCALIEASKHGVGKLRRPAKRHVFLPFDFSKTPDLAYELLARSCAPNKVADKAAGFSRQSMLECDVFLSGKKDFVTNYYTRAIGSGAGAKAVLVNSRKLPDGASYVMYAMMEHCMDEGMTYQGMSRLFSGTPNETVAIHFAKPAVGSKNVPSLNTYIIINDAIQSPVLLYVDSESKYLESSRVKSLDDTLREKLNASAEFLHKKGIHIPKMFSMKDPIGRSAVGTLYRANSEILSRASDFAQGWDTQAITEAYARRLKL